jgi:GT2 family glycosyltransferase
VNDSPHISFSIVVTADPEPARPGPGLQALAAAQATPDAEVVHCIAGRSPVDGLNEALRSTTGDWVVVLDPGDVLAPNALDVLRATIATFPDADLLYSDEDRMVDGIRVDPFHKPTWSPDRFRCQNYLGRLAAARRALVDSVGGFRPEVAGAHEWDLLLRVSERARRVVHVDEVLVHRTGDDPYDGLPASEPERAAGLRAVTEHLARTNIPARVSWGPSDCYELEPALGDEPLVSIVIPTAGTRRRVRGTETSLVENCIHSIRDHSTYRNFEIVCVIGADTPNAVRSGIEAAAGDARLRIAATERPFNFSDRVNLGAANSSGEYLVLLNDDVEVATPTWIEQMLMYAQDPLVGAVGGTLLFEDGRLQHAGVVMVNGNPGHAFRGFPGDWSGYRRNLDVPMNCLVVTAACLMTRREVFQDVGGLALALPLNYNDVDFCLKIQQMGLRVVHTPNARLLHFESASRGKDPVQAWEHELLTTRWGTMLYEDPYYSRHFLCTADFVALEGMDGRTAADIEGASAASGLAKFTSR